MGPLTGIRVLDFTNTHAGGFATMNLCDFGAEVIKIEHKHSRNNKASFGVNENGSQRLFCFINRGKRSVLLNLEDADQRSQLLQLIETADVICEDFTPGFMKQLGLDYETLSKKQKGLIYASISPFGQSGAYKDKPADGATVEAMSGFTDQNGYLGNVPIKAGVSTAEHFSAMYMASGICLALIAREETGKGQSIDISMLDSMVTSQEANFAVYSIKGVAPTRHGNSGVAASPYDSIRAKDGYVTMGISTDGQWNTLLQTMGKAEEIGNPETDTNVKRVGVHYEKVVPLIEEYSLLHDKFELEAALKANRLPCSSVYSMKEAMESAQTKAREMLLTIPDLNGKSIRVPGIVVKMADTPGEVVAPVEPLGASDVNVLIGE